MGFFSDFRSFLRTRSEFSERLERVERETRTLRHDHDELDEFLHRVSRKRYQNDYVPPEKEEVGQQPLPLIPGGKVSKAELWAKARQMYGVPVQKTRQEGNKAD